jgi:hypothetical protein
VGLDQCVYDQGRVLGGSVRLQPRNDSTEQACTGSKDDYVSRLPLRARHRGPEGANGQVGWRRRRRTSREYGSSLPKSDRSWCAAPQTRRRCTLSWPFCCGVAPPMHWGTTSISPVWWWRAIRSASAGSLGPRRCLRHLARLRRLVYKTFARSYKTVYKPPRPGSRRSGLVRGAPIRATCHCFTLIARDRAPRSQRSCSTSDPAARAGGAAGSASIGKRGTVRSGWPRSGHGWRRLWPRAASC